MIRQVRQQASDRPGDLALVQMALYEAWMRRKQHGDDLVESFVAVGGVSGALANAAEEVRTGRLDETEQQLLESVLVRLVVLGEAAGATRRTAKLVEFGPPGSPKRLLIDKLAGGKYGRLLLTGSDTVEICHEQLVTQWPWWQSWINAYALDMRRLARLMVKARDFFDAPDQERTTFLATGADLQIFSTLTAAHPDWLSETEQTFIADSQRQQQERIRQQEEASETERRLRRDAEENAAAAKANADKAEANARKAKLWLRGALLASLLLTVTAWGLGVAFRDANVQKAIAQAQTRLANDQTDLARQEQTRADAEAANAIARSKEALMNQSRFLTSQALQQLDLGKPQLAMNLAVAALPIDGKDQRPLVPESISAMYKVASADRLYRYFIGGHPALFSKDGRQIATVTGSGNLTVWDIASGSEQSTISTGDSEIGRIGISDDGVQLITCSTETTAKIWDLSTGAFLQELKGHSKRVSAAMFSHNKRKVITGSWDNTLRVWNASTGFTELTLQGHTDSVNSLALSPDENRIASASDDETVRVWDFSTGRDLAVLKGHEGAVESVLFSPTGQHILSVSEDGTAIIWDASSFEQVAIVDADSRDTYVAALSPDGSQVATGSGDGRVRFWETATGREVGNVAADSQRVEFLEYSSDGTSLLSGSNSAVVLWDPTRKEKLTSISTENNNDFVLLNPNGKNALSFHSDGSALLWDLLPDRSLRKFEGHSDQISEVSFDRNGRRFVTASKDTSATVWSTANDVEVVRLTGHTGWVTSAVFSKSGALIATASLDDTARLWDAENGKQLHLFKHPGVVKAIAFGSDDSFLVTTAEDGTIRRWDIGKGVLTGTLDLREYFREGPAIIRFGQDNKLLLASGYARDTENRAVLVDATRMQKLFDFKGHTAHLESAEFSPNGLLVATASADGTVSVWDAATGRQTKRLGGSSDWARVSNFSPDGKHLMTAAGKEAQIWDIESGAHVLNLKGHKGSINDASYSPNGKRILTWSSYEGVRIWDAATGGQIGYLEHSEDISHVSWDTSSSHIVVAFDDGRIFDYTIRPTEALLFLNIARARMWRPLTLEEEISFFLKEQPTQEPTCDSQAGDKYDPQRRFAGKLTIEIDDAIQLCESAISTSGGELRYVYQLGRLLDANKRRDEAFNLFQNAARAGYPMAYFTLGRMKVSGRGPADNDREATENLKMAFSLGVAVAGTKLADLMSEHGDKQEVWRLREQAARMGDPFANLALAKAAQTGKDGRTKDLHEAFKRYVEAEKLFSEAGDEDRAMEARAGRFNIAKILPDTTVADIWSALNVEQP
ncbi:nSTAND1 domain-containing NTPase [Rhizobium laguerreae]|uniref:nSTAND1 domain-containing NTPase n=2 Tax=Rhizobium laguerreae TaxID=1076926 RepID=UPI003704BAF6